MAGAQVRRHGDFDLEVIGLGVIQQQDDSFIGPDEVLRAASVSGLRRALVRWDNATSGQSPSGEEVALLLAQMPKEDFDPDFAVVHSTRLVWDDGVFSLRSHIAVAVEPRPGEVDEVAKAVLKPHAGVLLASEIFPDYGQSVVEIEMRLPSRAARVGDLIDRADALTGTIGATLAGELDAPAARDLLAGGAAIGLLGRYESDWLEAKSTPYRLNEEAQRFELAKDVAALANGSGGLLVLGAKTKRRRDGDEIISVDGCEPAQIDVRAYRQAIRSRIYPRIRGVKISFAAAAKPDRRLCVIDVPSADDADRPIVVRGMRVGTKTSGSGFAVPERDGDSITERPVEELHAQLRAGLRTSLARRN